MILRQTIVMKAKRTSIRALFIAVLAIASVSIFGSATQAQSLKVGYLDDQKVLANYDAWTRAQEEFATEMKAWEDEANRMNQNYVQDSIEFETQKIILTNQRRTERRAEISAKRTALNAFTKDVFGQNGQAERKQTALTRPLVDNMNAAVSKVATEGNYDIVFNASALAYINPAFDITDKVIEALANE